MSDTLQEQMTEAQVAYVFVDQVTTAGSAFGATNSGEAVFINSRIVNTLNVQHGDKLRAYVLPNYADKRHNVPWRALRAEVQGSIFEDISSEVKDARAEDLEPLKLEPDMETEELTQTESIIALLQDEGPLRTSYIADHLGASMTDAAALCYGLQQEGKLVRADVYSSPTNKRASLRIWAVNINDFDEGYTDPQV